MKKLPVRLVCIILSILSGIVGCRGDTVTAPAPLATQAYWRLQLTQHAINMATVSPYNTVQLAAIPYTELGTPLLHAGAVIFQASDSSVTVDSTGLVTAHFATLDGFTQVTASLTTQGVTLSDTAYIQVTDTIPQHPLTVFSMQPTAGDSAKRSIDTGGIIWPLTATDAAGTPLCSQYTCALEVYYTSSNPSVATINRASGAVTAYYPGYTVFTATTVAYGVTRQDSVAFTIGYALNEVNFITLAGLDGQPISGFNAPRVLDLGVGAVVEFWNWTLKPVDVEFETAATVDSATCPDFGVLSGSGNIPAFGGDTTDDGIPLLQLIFGTPQDVQCRRFPKPGVYRYYSTLLQTDTFQFNIRTAP